MLGDSQQEIAGETGSEIQLGRQRGRDSWEVQSTEYRLGRR
jgi:hypothetical protein